MLVVEHDEDAIRHADHVIDMGPGAGVHGGEVVCQGTLEDLLACETSLTADYLSGRREIPLHKTRRKGSGKFVTVQNATANNLQDVTVKFPLGTFTCVTGVSGSGKSSLTIDTLYSGAARALNGARIPCGPCSGIKGLEQLDKVIDIDQSPIGRTPRSNPATYTGAFTQIRDWFAGLPESKARGYKPGRFSFNVKGGRCEACQGDGLIKIEMHFLPDVYVTCDVCHGARYNRETLEVKFKGHSIADVLDMNVEEAAELFKAVPGIRDKMRMLQEVGLGYIKVGQTRDDAQRRRGPAREAVEGAVAPSHRQDPLHPRRAHHRPPLRGRPQAAGGAAPPGRPGQHRGRDRAQPRRHQDRGLGDRSRAGRRGEWRARSLLKGRRRRSRRRDFGDGAVSQADAGAGEREAGGCGCKAKAAGAVAEGCRRRGRTGFDRGEVSSKMRNEPTALAQWQIDRIEEFVRSIASFGRVLTPFLSLVALRGHDANTVVSGD